MCHTYTDRQTEKQRQTETDSHKQRQAEIDRNKHRKAEASRDRQRQIETDRDKQRQTEIDVRMWHCGCIPLAGKILGISLAIDVIDIYVVYSGGKLSLAFAALLMKMRLRP